MTKHDYRQWTELADRDAVGDPLSNEERELFERIGDEDPAAAHEREVWSSFAELPDTPGEDDSAMRRLVEGALTAGKGESEEADAAATPASPSPAAARPRWWIGAGTAAAAIAAGLAVWWSAPTPETTAPVVARAELTFSAGEVRVDGETARVGAGLLDEGSRIEVASGRACLAVDPGGDLCLAAGSSLTVARLDGEAREFRLDAGIAVADLAEQPADSHFRIETADGSATAVGTVFAVEIGADGRAATTVLEGEVAVAGSDGTATTVVIHQRAIVAGDVHLEVVDRSEEARLLAVLGPAELWKSSDPGSLHVSARPDGATVSVDGSELGPAPVSTLLPAGDHELEVTLDGHESHVDSTPVRPGQPTEIAVVLEALAPLEDEGGEEDPGAAAEPIEIDDGGNEPPARVAPPAQMLSEARRLMSEGRWRSAARAYQALRSAHPKSPEAHAALVTLGDLRLEHLRRARSALSAYDAYLRKGGGPMAQEARYGRIRALRKLGNAEREREAIEEFLRRHADSFEAAALRRRLDELKK